MIHRLTRRRHTFASVLGAEASLQYLPAFGANQHGRLRRWSRRGEGYRRRGRRIGCRSRGRRGLVVGWRLLSLDLVQSTIELRNLLVELANLRTNLLQGLL